MLLALCLTGVTDCTVSLAASAFEGNTVSFDFNWLRLNEVIFRYCVTCLECPFCNSCVCRVCVRLCVCVCVCPGPKLTIYSLHMTGVVCCQGRARSDWRRYEGSKGLVSDPWGAQVCANAPYQMLCDEKWTRIVWSVNRRLWKWIAR